jgi:hypothetical protein
VRREDGTDTARTQPAVDRLVRVLQYRRPESTSETEKRLVEAVNTADILETLEMGADAM